MPPALAAIIPAAATLITAGVGAATRPKSKVANLSPEALRQVAYQPMSWDQLLEQTMGRDRGMGLGGGIGGGGTAEIVAAQPLGSAARYNFAGLPFSPMAPSGAAGAAPGFVPMPFSMAPPPQRATSGFDLPALQANPFDLQRMMAWRGR